MASPAAFRYDPDHASTFALGTLDAMSRALAVVLAVALLAGCQSKPKPVASTYHAPTEVAELTTQAEIWACPQCDMLFDGPGQCPMDHIDLVHEKVAYICPADSKPVEHSGQCPRCNARAVIQRTALTTPAPKGLTGN